MFTIEFGRYVPTLKTTKCRSGKIYNLFSSIIDHTHNLSEEITSLDKLLSAAHAWLSDHYGFVIITMANQGEEDQSYRTRICNYKKTRSDLSRLGVEIRLENHVL